MRVTYSWVGYYADALTYGDEEPRITESHRSSILPYSSLRDGDIPIERDQLISALRAREQHLSAVIGRLESFVLIDQHWRFTFANAAAVHMAGLPLDELLGRDIRELAPRRVMDQALPHLAEAMANKRAVEFDTFGAAPQPSYRVRAVPVVEGGLALYVRDVTREAQAEAGLRESEERYRQLFHAESDAVVLIDQESGRLLDANDAATKLYGYSLEEFVELNALELSAEPEQSLSAVSAAVEHETAVIPFRMHRRKDGSPFPVEITGRVFELQGRPVRLAAIRDISERVRAEQALQESEEIFRAIFDQSQVGMVQVDPASGHFLRVNDAFCRFTGYERADLLGTSFFEITHPEDRAEDAVKLAALREGRIDSFESEKRYLRADGRATWGHVSVTLVRNAAGEPSFTIGVVQDVTARNEAEEALRESEERFRSLFENHSAVMLLIEPESGQIQDANEAATRFYGYSREQLQSMQIQQINQLSPEEVAAQRSMAADHSKTMFDFPHRLANGDVRFVEVHSSPVVVDGRPTLFSIIHDVTDRKRAEAELLQSEAAEAAQRERSRLARDLHDSVTQALFAAMLKAEALTTGGERVRVDALAEDVRRLSRGALAQMRTLLLELRGDPLEQMPIQQLLRNLAEATESRAHVEVWLTVESGQPLPPDVHVAVYRITQEALNNVARHSAADNAWVKLHSDPSGLQLSIRDDGHGFASSEVSPGHMGLRSMSERAAEIGGLLNIESASNRGTTLRLEWSAAES